MQVLSLYLIQCDTAKGIYSAINNLLEHEQPNIQLERRVPMVYCTGDRPSLFDGVLKSHMKDVMMMANRQQAGASEQGASGKVVGAHISS